MNYRELETLDKIVAPAGCTSSNRALQQYFKHGWNGVTTHRCLRVATTLFQLHTHIFSNSVKTKVWSKFDVAGIAMAMAARRFTDHFTKGPGNPFGLHGEVDYDLLLKYVEGLYPATVKRYEDAIAMINDYKMGRGTK